VSCFFVFSWAVSSVSKRYVSYRYCYEYENDNKGGLKEITPLLSEGQRVHYPIFHDKTCCHANDQVQSTWVQDGKQPLRDKS
jgi:hypothetical protein